MSAPYPRIEVAQGSLTDGSERVLVNASNTNVQLGSGVSRAIRLACGPTYQQHLTEALQARFRGPMEPGQVLVTDAGTHPRAKWVAHVAVMDYRQGFSGNSAPNRARIQVCCVNLWNALESIEGGDDDGAPLSVAMVALGAGTGGLGVNDPVALACTTLKTHLAARERSRIARVVFYGYELPEYLNTLEVVTRHFPLPEDSLPAEVREYLARKRSET
ncbi:macro domain-containing protein [Corallococcus llansteffanensis]|uniref:Macro domain-containing protein n=1 Tax=Corallococcus llansteffanensis TaxID=2316731 RepID=A0A3A8QKA9_9BACT|nr:macro domain-containing protein [Corallococcus llansteffanensis]RKH68201.1 hypothetical protein D7V93_01750 [Corallococcus llansteffanensis]